MKFIRKFESHRAKSKREQIINEAVLHVNDTYKVKTMVDIPQSLINKYVSKVKEETGTDLKTFFGNLDIAEEIVKYVNQNYIEIDKIPSGALIGEEVEETETEETEETDEVDTDEVDTEETEKEESEEELEDESESEESEEDFEEIEKSEDESEDGSESVESEEESEDLPL
jgi:cobalamin biosynthesis protein CobT